MLRDVGLLVLRVGSGGLLLGHGFGRAQNLFAGEIEFPDPIGIGPLPSLLLAVFAELVCAALVLVGFKTRFAAIPVVITMLVAVLVLHAGDPWAKRELALLYLVPFLALVFTGGGRLAVDTLISAPFKIGS